MSMPLVSGPRKDSAHDPTPVQNMKTLAEISDFFLLGITLQKPAVVKGGRKITYRLLDRAYAFEACVRSEKKYPLVLVLYSFRFFQRFYLSPPYGTDTYPRRQLDVSRPSQVSICLSVLPFTYRRRRMSTRARFLQCSRRSTSPQRCENRRRTDRSEITGRSKLVNWTFKKILRA